MHAIQHERHQLSHRCRNYVRERGLRRLAVVRHWRVAWASVFAPLVHIATGAARAGATRRG
eukprot:3675705-Alexandrium_andersonii.AAC.1